MQDIRNKLAARGISTLSDCELLALLLESAELAEALLCECGSLRAVATTQPARLRMIAGLGSKRAERIQMAAELGHRIEVANRAIQDTITSSDDVVRIMRPKLQDKKHEECWVLFLTNSNRIIEDSCMSQGGLQATIVDHRLIIKRALELLTPRIIVLHNHPSGCATPSAADVEITRKIKSAAALFDIELLDHIIISSSEHYSFKSNGKL